MKDILAEQLLANIMNWDSEKLAEERFQIQMFADIKYDNYQKYSQGMKYVESLALWLKCFDNDDRSTLYNFLKENLIYISEKQMRTLVEMSYPFYIEPAILKKSKQICRKANITDATEQEEQYKKLVKKSLFLGLSDGSHIDLFRRANPNLSNEQINVYYDMSQDKFTDMVKEMPESEIVGKGLGNIFLMDDFSGSGISFIRNENGTWKGKIVKLFNRLRTYGLEVTNIDLSLLLYVSTAEALNYINSELIKYKTENNMNAAYSVNAIQIINKPVIQPETILLLEKYYSKYTMATIEDSHYKKGKCEYPFLGFNSCALPLVIYHNTPNNSIPIIWFSNNDEYYGLFPRVTRHKEV